MAHLSCYPILVALFLFAVVSSAQEWAKKQVDASPRHLEWVELKYGTRQ